MESRIISGLPPFGRGQRIGLYGGSFNPAHEGHRRASLIALRRLDLDWLWWLVTPGNPLKDRAGLPAQAERMAAASRIARHPRIIVTGVEAALGTRFTADLVERLATRSPQTRFVWIMGSDNLAQFHRWERWREIARAAPIAVVNRPGSLAAALASPAAAALAPFRLDERAAGTLAGCAPPAWTFLTGPRTAVSSTILRSGVSGGHAGAGLPS